MHEREIFDAALAMTEPVERAAFLERVCSDAAQKAHLEGLLRMHEHLGSFLQAPAAAVVETAAEPPNPDLQGAVIGPYKLLEKIGEGGMGTVWMAQQTEPVKRVVALKLIKAGMDSKQVIARFEAERQALALMDHPNIAKVFDGGAIGASVEPSGRRDSGEPRRADASTLAWGRPYFVMELVKGMPITKYCDEHHLTPRQRMELFVPVCHAVQHAHQKGIIHRDLKPSNVLVALYDGKPVPKVIDFGVAKAAGQPLTEQTLVTGFGAIVGTLEYMSPEQAEVNQLDIDTRSDIYSLGVLLYELLTGSPPFSRKQLEKAGMLEMLRVIREQEPSKPSTKLSTAEGLPTLAANRGMEPAKLTKLLRGELDWIVMKALEKDRNRRYETANGFAMDVMRYLADEPVLACPPSAGYRLKKFARRNKVGLAVAALVFFFLVLLGSGVGWALRDRSAREAEAARQQGERQAKAAGQVESIFFEVDRLEKEQKWPEALAAARWFEVAVAGGEADAATTERVRERLRDLEFIDRLEHIRMERSSYWAETDREYARAFRDYGVDIEELAVEVSIQRLKARPALAFPLAVALDEWVFIRRGFSKGDNAGWKRLVAVAHGLDPEPLRDRLRSTPWPAPPETHDELRRLAESIDVRAHHPATLYRLAVTLGGDHARRILKDAQAVYPGDFWLNDELGRALYKAHSKQDLDEAIRFWTVAVAVRPSAGRSIYPWLGHLLRKRGDLDGAIAAYRNAMEAKPESNGIYFQWIGDILRDQKKPAEAADAYRKAEAAYRSAGEHDALGRLLRAQGRPDEAIAVYRLGIEADPQFALVVLRAIRDTLIAQGKPDEAIAVYRQRIEARPEEAGHFWRDIGDILRDQKKPAEAADAYRKAIAAYRKAIESRPEAADINWYRRAIGDWWAIGDLLIAQEESNEALAAYRQVLEASRKAIEVSPERAVQNGAEVQTIGTFLRRQGKPDEAVAVYRMGIETVPELAGSYFSSIGDILREQKKLDKAADAYRKASELKPNDPGYHHRLALALRDQNKPAEANVAFDKASELYRQTPDLTSANRYYNIGVVLRDQGKLDEAIAAFRKALDIAPTYALVIRDLVAALRARGRPDEAIDVYRKVVEADPKDFDNHKALGAALIQFGKLDEAIDVCRKAVEFAPTSNMAAGVYFEIGNAFQGKKRTPEAIAAYYRVIELDPKNFADGAYFNLGIALRDWGKLDEAAAAFRKVIAMNHPKATIPAYVCLCDVLQQQNKLNEVIDVCRTIIKLKPDAPLTHNRLAWILATRPEADLRDPKQAVALASRAVALKPEDGSYRNTLGVAHYRAGNWKDAIAALEKSMELRKGGDGYDWFFLAMAHWQLGEKDKARQWHDRAVKWMDKNQPKNEELRRFRTEATELLEIEKKKIEPQSHREH